MPDRREPGSLSPNAPGAGQLSRVLHPALRLCHGPDASLLALGAPRSPLVLSPVPRRTNKEKSQMAVFNGAFPILSGKEQDGRDFAAACTKQRRKGFEAQLARSGLTRETW